MQIGAAVAGVDEIKRMEILPGFGIQLQQTSAGTAVSIDHGGVVAVAGSASSDRGLLVSSVFPAYLAAASTAELVTTGVYRYKFYAVLGGLGNVFLDIGSNAVQWAYNINEYSVAAESAAGDTLVMMHKVPSSNLYVFAL